MVFVVDIDVRDEVGIEITDEIEVDWLDGADIDEGRAMELEDEESLNDQY